MKFYILIVIVSIFVATFTSPCKGNPAEDYFINYTNAIISSCKKQISNSNNESIRLYYKYIMAFNKLFQQILLNGEKEETIREIEYILQAIERSDTYSEDITRCGLIELDEALVNRENKEEVYDKEIEFSEDYARLMKSIFLTEVCINGRKVRIKDYTQETAFILKNKIDVPYISSKRDIVTILHHIPASYRVISLPMNTVLQGSFYFHVVDLHKENEPIAAILNIAHKYLDSSGISMFCILDCDERYSIYEVELYNKKLKRKYKLLFYLDNRRLPHM